MIEQQLGFSLESFLRGIVGISTVLGVAYLMSYDRKRVDWKLVGGGLFMQFVFALAVLYVPVVGIVLEWVGKAFIKLMDFTQSGVAFLLGPLVTKSEGFIFLLNSLPVVIFFSALVSLFYYWGYYPARSGRIFLAATTFHEYFRSRRIGCVWQCVFGNDGIPCFDQELSAGDEPVGNISGYGFRNGDDSRNSDGNLYRYVGGR